MLKKLLKLLIIFIVALLCVSGGLGYWLYTQLHSLHTHKAEQILLSIAPGTSKREIINRLAQQGIISTKWPLLIYLTINSQEGKLQAGDYLFESPITPLEVVKKLRQGLVATEQFTIPEGYDKFDISEILINKNIDTKEAIQKAINDVSLIKDLDPQARNLEGYLSPNTYTYTRNQHAPQIVAAMVKQFRQMMTPARQQRLKELGLNLRELVTLASLVEREAKVDLDRPLIAAVFYNRIKRNIRLDCDPTFIYAAKLAGEWDNNVNNPAHRKIDSLYNTYYYAGLPSGPIASPGIKSLDAALNPAPVDYIYFVATGTDGRHKFSRTEAEHLAAVAAYRQQLKQTRNQ